MLRETTPQFEADEWASRSEYWASREANRSPRRPKRQRQKSPLILCGHGIHLRVDRGTLFVRDGFTHYPQTKAELRFFPGDLETPDRIIIIDGSGGLSLAVLDWFVEQGITLVRIGWNGKSIVTLGGSSSFVDPEKIVWQFATSRDERKRTEFAARILAEKLQATLETLNACLPNSKEKDSARKVIGDGLKRLAKPKVQKFSDLYAIEGPCAQSYFAACRGLKLNWKKKPRDLIPPAWLEFDSRSSLLSGKKQKNWKASHPINAMLNYGYAMLEADLRIKCITQGFDPRIGIAHRPDKGSPDPFLFDVMEPFRPVVDRAVLEFALSETFSPKDFVLRSDGVCRLSPQLARALAGRVSEAFVECQLDL